jgi:hypothetical protein
MEIATNAGLRDWRDAWSTAGNLGLGGQDTRANLGVTGANARGDMWSNLAGGVSRLINPPQSLADIMKQFKFSLA